MKHRAALFATLILAACDAGPGARPDATQAGIVPPIPAEVKPATPVEPRRPANIYYDLTSFDWYARGEPLVDGSNSFTPGGGPVALPLAELEHVGNYQGVDIYKHRSASDRDSSRYVPVYEGFWLRFASRAADVVEPD